MPKRPRREVVYLTAADEVQRFIAAIPLSTQRGKPCLVGLRFRALVEALF